MSGNGRGGRESPAEDYATRMAGWYGDRDTALCAWYAATARARNELHARAGPGPMPDYCERFAELVERGLREAERCPATVPRQSLVSLNGWKRHKRAITRLLAQQGR